MKDVSAKIEKGVTADSLFLSVEFNEPKLMGPDWRYAITDNHQKQPKNINIKNEDDFQIYGNQHKNQQLFRFYPETGLILSERYLDMGLTIKDEFFELDQKNSISDWKWKVRETAYDSLFALGCSNMEIQQIYINVIKSKPDLPNNNTQTSVNKIQSDLTSKTLNLEENIVSSVSEQNGDTFKTEGNNLTKKKKNTTIWIFISVIVILIIVSIFVKIGCFPNYSVVQSNNQNDSEGAHSG